MGTHRKLALSIAAVKAIAEHNKKTKKTKEAKDADKSKNR